MAADEEETMKKTAVNATEGSHKCTKVMHVVSRKKKKIVPGKRRRSRRGMSSMEELAKLICRSGGEVERLEAVRAANRQWWHLSNLKKV